MFNFIFLNLFNVNFCNLKSAYIKSLLALQVCNKFCSFPIQLIIFNLLSVQS
jgi:hypothetical protein